MLTEIMNVKNTIKDERIFTKWTLPYAKMFLAVLHSCEKQRSQVSQVLGVR